MAITRITLRDIEDDILRIMGFSASEKAPWKTSGYLYRIINRYIQNLPIRCAAVMQLPVDAGSIRFDMYKTVSNSSGSGTGLVCTAGSSTVTLPENFDRTISWYDLTEKRQFDEISGADRWFVDALVTKPSGSPVEAVELMDFVDGRRRGTLYPSIAATVTPSIRLTYYRLATSMPGSSPDSEYPDVDPKYQDLCVCGPVVELARNTGFEFDRYTAMEREYLADLAATARSV